jgi:cyclopropane fatty-acyl-phospholipid synthase-like methyltransferase
MHLLLNHNPNSILDIGAGAGKYGHIAKIYDPGIHVDAVEVWEPYVSQFELELLYTRVSTEDVRNMDDFKYDLVIMGDVLEHMTKEDAQALVKRVSKQAKTIIISIPVTHCPQGHVHGNPYEEHVKDDWTHTEVMQSFGGITDHRIFDETATYFLDNRF